MNFGIIYIVLLLLFLIFGYLFGRSKLRIFLFVSDFVISLPAYFVHPAIGVYFDTIRFENILDQIRIVNANSGIFEGLKWTLDFSEYANQPVVSFYLWIFSFFQNNGMLFFITTFLFLSFLSALLLEIQKRMKIRGFSLISVQFVILMTFNLFYQIEGIRNFLSFIIFSWALFKDLNSKNRSSKIVSFGMYFLAILIHPITLPFVLFRMIILIRSRVIFINNKIFDLVMCFLLLIYSYFNSAMIIVLERFDYISFIDSILMKTQSYVYGQSGFQSFSNRSEVLFTSIVLLSIVFELLLFAAFRFSNILPEEYLNFYFYVIFFTLGSFLNTQIYLRTVMLLLFLSAPMKMVLFNKEGIKGNAVYLELLYEFSIYVIAIIGFVIWYGLIYKNVLIF